MCVRVRVRCLCAHRPITRVPRDAAVGRVFNPVGYKRVR